MKKDNIKQVVSCIGDGINNVYDGKKGDHWEKAGQMAISTNKVPTENEEEWLQGKMGEEVEVKRSEIRNNTFIFKKK